MFAGCDDEDRKSEKIGEKVSYRHGHGGPSKSCFKIKENVQDEDIEKYL